ncbi:MAG: hypothetical protein V7K47_02785 [Nostoc sp.]
MKSIQRPSKPPSQQPKSPNPSLKPELVAYQSREQPPVTLEPDPTPIDEPSEVEQQAQAIPVLTPSTNAAEKPQSLEKGKAESTYPVPRKSNSPQQPKQQPQFRPDDDEELPSQQCQHIQFLDCDKPIGRIIFECYHCQQGILSEFTGDPAMGEYFGRPSVIQVKIKCPNCEQTAIRLTTGKVLSITAIPSPWR